jgi:hypothetical protein
LSVRGTNRPVRASAGIAQPRDPFHDLADNDHRDQINKGASSSRNAGEIAQRFGSFSLCDRFCIAP